jgi:hypothetical protein
MSQLNQSVAAELHATWSGRKAHRAVEEDREGKETGSAG